MVEKTISYRSENYNPPLPLREDNKIVVQRRKKIAISARLFAFSQCLQQNKEYTTLYVTGPLSLVHGAPIQIHHLTGLQKLISQWLILSLTKQQNLNRADRAHICFHVNVFFRDSEVIVLCSPRSILIRICIKVTPDSVSLLKVRYTLTGRACGVLFEICLCVRRVLSRSKRLINFCKW